MLIHQLPLDAALSTLRSTPAGLSRAEAAARRLEFGANRIERLARVSLPSVSRLSSRTSLPRSCGWRQFWLWWLTFRCQDREWRRWRWRSWV